MGESQRDVALLQRLRELGWIEGRTLAIEYRWAENRFDRYDEVAAEFVRLKVDAIVTFGTAVPAFKQATSAIPIVFAIDADPVGRRLVASLARPGGNVTGLSLQSTDLVGKRLELLREVRCPPVGGHGKCRLSQRSAGGERGSGGGPQAWP
jgi:putative ABC transport system substrate-binding protein